MRKSRPAASSARRARANWVDLPEPSVPSKTINLPAMADTSLSLDPGAYRREEEPGQLGDALNREGCRMVR